MRVSGVDGGATGMANCIQSKLPFVNLLFVIFFPRRRDEDFAQLVSYIRDEDFAQLVSYMGRRRHAG